MFFNNEYRICLRYTFSGKKEFTEYESELEKNEYYDRTVDISKTEVLYVFHIPDELYEIIDLFLSGKYSYLPEKDTLIEYLEDNFGLNEDSKIIQIINRDERLKEQIEEEIGVKIPEGLDLSSVPDVNNENYIYTPNAED